MVAYHDVRCEPAAKIVRYAVVTAGLAVQRQRSTDAALDPSV